MHAIAIKIVQKVMKEGGERYIRELGREEKEVRNAIKL